MKINAISNYQTSPLSAVYARNKVQNVSAERVNATPRMFHITFEGNPDKKPWQMLNVATESSYYGGIYSQGGLGSVESSFSPAVINQGSRYTVEHKTPDLRVINPYYTFDKENDGKIFVLTKEGNEKAAKGEALERKTDFKVVDQNYTLQEGEDFALITEEKGGKLKWFRIKDTGISGTVERMKRDAFEMESVPYRMFEAVIPEADKKAHPETRYLIHTKEMARGAYAYGWDDTYRDELDPLNKGKKKKTSSSTYAGSKPGSTLKLKGRNSTDLFPTEWNRATEDALKKMNAEAFGHFNPQNIVSNDRFNIPLIVDMLREAAGGDTYAQGVRFSHFLHNPGDFYQGATANPIDFFKVLARKEDLEKLKANPNFPKVEEIAKKIAEGKATSEESQQIYEFFKPYFTKLEDSDGLFNLTMGVVAATEQNPENVVAGHVSRNYSNEATQYRGIAPRLTEAFARIDDKVVSIVNGENAASMATEKQDGFFGRGTLSEIFKDVNNPRHYVPFKKDDPVDVIYAAKQQSKKNFIEIMAEATRNLDKDPDALAKVLLASDYIKSARESGEKEKFTLGGFSEFREGDLLFFGWGRPDPQKGFAVSVEGYKKFLADESIPMDIRKRCKFILGGGSGDNIFREGSKEWELIQKSMKEIGELEGGAFKGNIIYFNGLLPSRIVNFSDLCVLTSRYEPCGITPLESFAGGTPVASVKTGGAPDFVAPGKNGLLTKNPYMRNPEDLGLTAETPIKKLEAARLNKTAEETAEMLKEYVSLIENKAEGGFDYSKFITKQKEYIVNALSQKIGWDENNAYNNGKSALELHMTRRMRTQDNEVPTEVKADFFGNFNDHAFDKKPTDVTGGSKGWWAGLSKGSKAAIIGGVVAVGAAAVYGAVKSSNKNDKAESAKSNTSTAVMDAEDDADDTEEV